nr:trypsin-like peptidase domain-containing protein [Bacteroidota bacterium]
MNKYIILSIFIGVIFTEAYTQENISNETIRSAQRNVCAINIMNAATGKTIALGCGVVFSSKVKDRNEYFIATAFHIVKNLAANESRQATITVFDNNGNVYIAEGITTKHVFWSNLSMDAALLVLPRDLKPGGNLPDDYEFPGLANLKLIGEPDWGEDIYLFGYRWINESAFIDILKKGILSVGTTDLPGYEGHLVYLIDNMANKGMSGGLAFDGRGVGIGIISSYVYETDNEFLNSDDLTVCLPLTMYFNVLGSVIINKPELINEIIGE